MNELTLHRLLNRLLYASLAATGALISCGGTGPDATLYDAPLCTATGALSVSGLKPGSAVDYLELRRTDPGGTSTTPVSSSGTKCGTASDMTICNSTLSSLTAPDGFHSGCLPGNCFHYLATTQADTVASVTSEAALKTFLSTVDTPQEAVLLAFANEYDISCTDKTRGGVQVDPSGDGYQVLATRMTKDCDPIEITGFQLHVTKSGTVSVLSSTIISSQKGACVGRRPVGLVDAEPCDGSGAELDAVGDYVKGSAELEAAAVVAFDILGHELAAHGAPPALAQKAARAARDEVRHARLTARLARRYRATPQLPRVAPHGVRELFDVALENAVEGCVRETYGALVALWQAKMARDPAVAQAMIGIARDEVRHAALSHSVARWADRVLPEPRRKHIKAAQAEAVRTLRAEVTQPQAAGLATLLGLPTPAQAEVLLDALQASLWQTA